MIIISLNSKLIDKTCENYICIDDKGYIEFNYTLKRQIDLKKISKEDALTVFLELLYLIRTHKIKSYANISLNEFNLIRDIKSDKKSFHLNYSTETIILEKYLNRLFKNNKIDNDEALDSNINFINKVYKKCSNSIYKPQSDNSHNDVAPSISLTDEEKLKNCLNKFNKMELCEILGLNHELTFDKEKSLRNTAFKELLKLDLNYGKIDDKNYLISIYSNHKQKEDQLKKKKKEFNQLLSKIREFNNKDILDMISLENEYTEIYEKINFDECYKYDEIMEFKENFKAIDEFKANNFVNEVEKYSDTFKEFQKSIENSQYLTIEEISRLKEKYLSLFSIISNYPNSASKFKIGNGLSALSKPIRLLLDLFDYDKFFTTSETNLIKRHNEVILDNHIKENPKFFADISDVNKKRAIAIDEKNVKVIAGAGTGKTFTIRKKVKYLIENLGISPEKILCLCYTNKGTIDLNEKVNKDLGDDKVEVCTFHEFARRIDRYCGGNKTTNRYLLDQVIRNYISGVMDKPDELKKIAEYFSYYINTSENKGYNSYDELLEFENAQDLTTLKKKYYCNNNKTYTLKGEVVKSLGELIIANYLFMHEIEYEYERNYNRSFKEVLERFSYSGNFFSLRSFCDRSNEEILKDFIDNEKRWERYQPDFYLPEYDIYLEHFGLGRVNNEKWLHANYEKEMEDKILCHNLHKTKLIKTYYYNLAEGDLLDELERLLNDNNVEIGQMDQKEVLEILNKSDNVEDFKRFKKLIKDFINIFEAKNYDKSYFKQFTDSNEKETYGYARNRQELLLSIIEDVYDEYCMHNQGDTIDHNREISNALQLVKSHEYDKSYDYILIDEYQDINYIRCELIMELQKSCGAKIFVVGDDWQSIYRFNGSDVNLFIEFDKYFPNSETIKIEENRRNSQKINDITSEFILKNKNQEEKELIYYKNESLPNNNPIKIVTFDRYTQKYKNFILKLDAIIDEILKNNNKPDLRILLLSRNKKYLNNIINNALFKKKKDGKYVKVIYSRKPSLDITFMTLHQSKGLEYDEVIVLNFEGHFNGFPNQINDDSILRFVKNDEEFPFAEERRLLYVALTRTRNNVYLIAPDFDESVFIEELRDDFDVPVKNLRIDKEMELGLYKESEFFKRYETFNTNVKCPNCEDGYITLLVDNERDTKYFRCTNDPNPRSYHFDGGPYTGTLEDLKYVEKCPSCRGVLVRRGDILQCCLNYHENCLETRNLKLDEDDLKYDEFEK